MDTKKNIKIVEFNLEDSKISLKYEIVNFELGMEVAYYIYRDNKKEEVIWYKKCERTNSLQLEVRETSIYHIKIFTKFNGKINFTSTPKLEMKSDVAKKICKSERIFELDEEVKYILQRNKSSDKLVVIFSGISKGEYTGGAPLYNYVRKLGDLQVNKLFILDDYEGQFCYYKGKKDRHDFEKAIVALITTIVNEMNISPKNIISIGSSKGGTAALYYGIKYNYGSVFIGAPQVHVADYLNKVSKKYPVMEALFENMLGKNREESYERLNNYIVDLFDGKVNFPKFNFHIGIGDKYHRDELQIVLDILDNKGITYDLDMQEYSNHGETGTYFYKYVVDNL